MLTRSLDALLNPLPDFLMSAVCWEEMPTPTLLEPPYFEDELDLCIIPKAAPSGVEIVLEKCSMK